MVFYHTLEMGNTNSPREALVPLVPVALLVPVAVPCPWSPDGRGSARGVG